MNKDEFRHQILCDMVAYNKKNGNTNEWPIDRDTIISLGKDKGFMRAKALNFLVAYKYLIYSSGLKDISITPKGFEALNSEYFLHEGEKHKWDKQKHFWTIAFGVITALGVIFTIWHDTLRDDVPQEKKSITILIQQLPNKIPQISDSLKKIPSANHINSPTIHDPK